MRESVLFGGDDRDRWAMMPGAQLGSKKGLVGEALHARLRTRGVMRTEFAWLHARWQQKSLLNLFGFCALNHASSRTAPPSNASSTPRDDWAFASNRPFHSFGISWAWQKRIKAAPPAASTQPSPLIKRQPRQNGLPCASHGAPPRRGSSPHGHSARRLPSMHEIPGRDLADQLQRDLGQQVRLRGLSSTCERMLR